MNIDVKIRMLFAELDAALRLKRDGTTNVWDRFNMIFTVKQLRGVEEHYKDTSGIDITAASLGDHC